MKGEVIWSQMDINSFIITICAYVPLVIGVWRNRNNHGQTATTWLLYTFLDGILSVTMFIENGNYQMPLGFTFGSIIMTIILIYQGKVDWSIIETIITFLVLICVALWVFGGPMLTIIFGIFSQSIVGLYLIYRTFLKPEIKYNLISYLLFLASAIYSLLIAENSDIEEIGYAITEIFLSIFTIYPLIRKCVKENA